MVERSLSMREVAGSMPASSKCIPFDHFPLNVRVISPSPPLFLASKTSGARRKGHDPGMHVRARIAQSVEHQTFNLRVQGSSPCSGDPSESIGPKCSKWKRVNLTVEIRG